MRDDMAFGATAPPKKLTALLFLSFVLTNANPGDSYRECWNTTAANSPTGLWCLEVRIKDMKPGGCIVAGNAFTLSCRLQLSPERLPKDDQAERQFDYAEIPIGGMKWYKDGQPIGEGKVGAHGLTYYEINSSQIGDSGNYTCKLRDWNNKNFERTIYVNVNEPAGKITTNQSSIRVKLHDSVTLTCHVKGHSPSNSMWLHTGIEGVFNVTNLGKTWTINNTDSTMTLHLSKVTLDMRGIYECRALICSIEFANSINLTVFDIPEVSIDARAVGDSRVCLKWTLDDGNGSTKVSAVRRKENSTEASRYVKASISNSSMLQLQNALIVDNLNKSTTYKFKVVFMTSAGDSFPTYSEWVTTLDKDPDFIPKLAIKGVTLDSIDVRAPSLPVELQGWVDYYRVMVTDSEEGKQLHNWTNIDKKFSTKNLTPETNYRLRVAACNTCLGKCGNWSDEEEVSTAGKEFNYVANISVKATKNDSIKIGWNKPKLDEIHRILEFEVKATSGNDTKERQLNRERVSYIFKDLQPNATYEFGLTVCIYGSEDCAEKYPSAPVKADTIDREPKFVPTVSVRETTLNSIVVAWTTPPEHLRGEVYHYKVMATNQNETRGPIYLSNRTTSFTFGDLRSQTEFQLRVAACGPFSEQCGKWSNTEIGVTIDQGSIPWLWPCLGAVAVVIVIGIGVATCLQRHREKVMRQEFNNVMRYHR